MATFCLLREAATFCRSEKVSTSSASSSDNSKTSQLFPNLFFLEITELCEIIKAPVSI